MEIGIIGAGFIGGTLARKLAAVGHHVRIANSRRPETLTEFDGVDSIQPMWAVDAVTGVDVAIVSVPQKAVEALPEDVIAALASVPVVIDTGNYYPVRDGNIDELDQGMTDSAWVAARLGRPVYKAFNNIGAPSLKHKATDDAAQRLGLTVAGPDGDAKQRVMALIDQIGFDPVDAGDLEDSWRLQPGTPTYCRDMNAEQLRAGLAETVKADVENYRAARDSMTAEQFAAANDFVRQLMA
jgi:8-hydroxy-5-deazaflavin:NADPH oxidoreductase